MLNDMLNTFHVMLSEQSTGFIGYVQDSYISVVMSSCKLMIMTCCPRSWVALVLQGFVGLCC